MQPPPLVDSVSIEERHSSKRPLIRAIPPRVWLTAILLLAAALRFNDLPRLGFWTDELFSLSDANGWGLQSAVPPPPGLLPPGQPHLTRRVDRRGWPAMIEELSRSEIHPPLYFLMLRGWEDLLGGAEDEIPVRSLSVLLSLAAVGLLYAAVREQHPPATALWASALMAVAGPQIEYAQEARDYAPILPFLLAAVWALLRIERLGVSKLRLAGLSLSMLALLLTHYFSAGLVGAMGLYVLLQFRGRLLLATLAAFVVSGTAYAALWGPFLLRQVPRFVEGHSWLIVPRNELFSRECWALLDLPARYLFETGGHGVLEKLAPWLAILWVFVPLGILHHRTRVWALSVVVPLAVLLASDVAESMTQLDRVRFTFGATPGFYVLVAAGGEMLIPAASRARRLRRLSPVLPAGCLLLCALALAPAYTPPWKLDYRTPAAFVAARMNPRTDALVFVAPPGDALWLGISYHDIRHYLPRDPQVMAVLQSRADASLLDRLSRAANVWVISRPLHAPLQTYLPGFVAQERGDVPALLSVWRGTITPATTAPAPPPGLSRPR